MNSNKPFQEQSYQLHSENFNEYSSGGTREAHAQTWLDNDTADSWRHQRVNQLLDPILAANPKSKWLTVGDGRYGKDAKYILENNCYALPTDISESLLKDALNMGFISEFKIENAEALSFQDSEFDFVLCKESYHHFPRPMLAVYEMLRVANQGIVLIEPNDLHVNNKLSEVLFRTSINLVKRLLGRKINVHAFEVVGNYVYRISRREIEKTALGLNYKFVAFKGLNDAYVEGIEFEKLSSKGPLLRKVKAIIGLRNFLSKTGLMDDALLTAIIFKKTPNKQTLELLKKDGYDVVRLPDNPYLSN